MYSDSDFDESVNILFSASNVVEVILSVASGDRHFGVAGTGVRILGTAIRKVTLSYQGSTTGYVEWLEIDNNTQSNTNNTKIIHLLRDGVSARNCMVHGGHHNRAFNALTGIGCTETTNALNCIVYDISSIQSGGSCVGIDATNLSNSQNIMNCVVQNITAIDGSANGYNISNQSTKKVQNCIAMDCDTDFSVGASAVFDHCLSSDLTATGTGSLTSQVSSSVLSNPTLGSEDLHLKLGSNAIDAGLDLGVSPVGVEIDIDSWNRDSDTPTRDPWDMGAHEFDSGGGGGPTFNPAWALGNESVIGGPVFA